MERPGEHRRAGRAKTSSVIVARELSKSFSGVVALDTVSFEARSGEVLGFLGPNGAGKTTTMRLLTGYLAPTGGQVTVCGIDLARDSKRARAQIGYLPENVPLYPEMRISEYLAYRAALKGLPAKERKRRIEEVSASVGLTAELRRIIGQLSKGYRQRVGLADALLHRPKVLILDEPTDGLDPNQRREVLALVAELGKTCAVILSTHILPEVESLCGRVVILDRGKILAEGRPEELGAAQHAVEVNVRGDAALVERALREVEGVTEVVRVGGAKDESVVFRAEATRDVREAVAAALQTVGKLRELRPARGGLDEIFRRLTARGGER